MSKVPEVVLDTYVFEMGVCRRIKPNPHSIMHETSMCCKRPYCKIFRQEDKELTQKRGTIAHCAEMSCVTYVDVLCNLCR